MRKRNPEDQPPLEPVRGTSRPIVAIVGRPNVGKSTLFNRIVGRKLAIVEDIPGVTRDRNYADTDWTGHPFTIVDTGGFLPDTEDKLLQRVREQATLAIEESQVVVLVVDGLSGCSAADAEVASMLRKSGKALFLVVNKLDSERRVNEEYLTDFYRLGIQQMFPVSAEHGRGVGEFLDAVVENFPRVEALAQEELEEQLADETLRDEEGRARRRASEDDVCRVAIVGRPNAGKSTFVNKLLGEERFVASEIPGTTRDSIDSDLAYKGRQYVLTDTAGIRKKRNIASRLEEFTVMRSMAAIDRADVVILLLDAKEPTVEQDAKIASVAIEKGKAIVVLVNKWDLIENVPKAADKFRNELNIHMPFLSYMPTLFVSALTGNHVFKALSTAGEMFDQYCSRIPTPLVNDFLRKIVDEHPAPLADGHPVKLFYMAQITSRPPTFAISVNKPEGVTDDYKRFITNRMRESFGLQVPIRLIMRRKSKREFVPRETDERKLPKPGKGFLKRPSKGRKVKGPRPQKRGRRD